jgi:uncharacterized LabA/DUF88 family protein
MKRKVIVFIDGNNFYHNLKKIIDKPKQINFIKLINIICLRFDLDLVEIRYYNSIPKSKDEVYKKHLEFLDNLKSKNIIIKTRELHGRGKYKREKGIDILIAVDMINKCLIKKECDVCVIVTGDADFLPVMEIIKESKKEAIVSSVYSGFSNKFREGKFRYLILKKQDVLDCLEELE